MASQWCSALQQWTITTYFSWMKWWKHETGHHSQLLKSLLPSPHSLLWGWACTGIPLILTPDLQTPCHWEPEAGQGFGNEQTCSGVEGCTGLRWQRISQVSPYMKIRMLNRNCPRTIRKSGRITFIQLLSVFPRQNSHQRCQMHSDFPPCTLGIAIKRRDWAPSPYARRDSRKSKNWRYLLGV